ncbi:MAG: TonB-dependent receptor plug domain-containing protein [Niastella sp.]|nr:TonB-dependent receptor plug domain-containing protein [Niastella sp.]
MKSKIAAMLLIFPISIVQAQSIQQPRTLVRPEQIIRPLAGQNGYHVACKEKAWDLIMPMPATSLRQTSLTTILNTYCHNGLLTYSILESVIRFTISPLGDSVLDGHYTLFFLLDQEGEPLQEVKLRINGGAEQRYLLRDKGILLLPGLQAGDSIRFLPSLNTEEVIQPFGGSTAEVVQFPARIAALSSLSVKRPNGYQDIDVDHVTGASKVADPEQYNKSVGLNILDRLRFSLSSYQPYVPGIPGGLPVTGTTRGISTIDGNMGLLYVLDNVPVRNLDAINPNDIATITIAHDAATMALYGSRAANGVVIMTSKRSRSGKLHGSFTNHYSYVQSPTDLSAVGVRSGDHVDLTQQLFNDGAYDERINKKEPLVYLIAALADHRNGILSQAGLDSIVAYAKAQDIRRDLGNYFYQPSISRQSHLQLAQSFSRWAFSASIGNDQASSPLQGELQHRTTSHLTLHSNVINRISSYLHVYFAHITGHRMPYRLSRPVSFLTLADREGNPLPVEGGGQTSLSDTMADGQKLSVGEFPVQELRMANNQYTQSYFTINPGINWQVKPWLSLDLLYHHGKNDFREITIHHEQSLLTRNELRQHSEITDHVLWFKIAQGAIADTLVSSMQFNDLRAQANITIKGDRNQFFAIAGIETQSTTTHLVNSRTYGYGTAQPEAAETNTRVDSFDYYTGIYLNAIYSIKDKFIFSGSLRKDQLNRYGPQPLLKGWPFYSAGTAIHLHKVVPFFSKLSALTFRATIGESGNDSKSLLLQSTILSGGLNPYKDPVADIDQYANTQLEPERVQLINAGVDLALKDSSFQFGFDIFRKRSHNLWNWKQLHPNAGGGLIKSNSGSLKGYGFDLYMNARYGWRALALNSSAWFSYSTNTITSPLLPLDKIYKYTMVAYYRPQIAHPVNAFYAFRFAGLDQQGNPTGFLNGNTSKDYEKIINSGDPSSIRYVGPATPRYYGGFTQSMLIRDFIEVAFQVSYKLGYFYKRSSLLSGDVIKGIALHSDFYRRWQKPGDELTTSVPAIVATNYAARDIFYEHSEALIQPADHIRLEFLRLGLVFDHTKLRVLKKSLLNFYLTVHNLKPIWTKNLYHEDPETIYLPYRPGKGISVSMQLNF